MGGGSLSRTAARARRAARVRDTIAIAGLLALWLAWWHVLASPGPTRAEAALACARASDGADGSIAHCYTVRGLAVPGDL